MANIISLSSIIFGCILLVHAEPATTKYSIRGDSNGFDYNTNAIKDGHRETTDFYAGGNSGHSANSRSQGSLEESLRTSTYSGFSPSSHESGFQGFSSSGRENLGTSSYFSSDPAQSSFDGFTTSNGNGDTTFDSYAAQSNDQTGSDFGQFSSNKHKTSAYMRFSDNLPGASTVGSFTGVAPESSAFREYSGDAFRSHASDYTDSEQAFGREPSNLFNSPANDYSYGKHKEGVFGMGGGNKYATDSYPLHTDMRYVRGNHGTMGRDYASTSYLSTSASSPFGGLRGTSGPYSSGKVNKYNKYVSDYAPSAGLNYLSKDLDADYLFSNYGKGSGKSPALKDSRPSSYGGQAYLGGPSYLNKIAASYKSKPSYMNYPSSSPIGYPSMSSLHSSFNGNSYADSPILRRYRSSSGYIPGHGSIYSGYY
ncbi:uncharacterized protein LOC143343557 [Colletes latitarsis]|uniref:uncharacterized protein LOC143343557 n=1 Tax=Colletes latitarsis TaxID=2605962 RepID=UPI0040368D61